MGRRNLGELGENTLRVWASQEGATLNKANVDRSGWDFILEFPVDNIDARSEPDKRDEAYQCLIQVKSTDSLKSFPSIKLSNWKRLVETPLPAFFVILHFDGEDTCQSAFLVHVWKSEIARVLKCARDLGVKGKGSELHKHSLRLKWDGHVLSSGVIVSRHLRWPIKQRVARSVLPPFPVPRLLVVALSPTLPTTCTFG